MSEKFERDVKLNKKRDVKLNQQKKKKRDWRYVDGCHQQIVSYYLNVFILNFFGLTELKAQCIHVIFKKIHHNYNQFDHFFFHFVLQNHS